MLPNDSRGGATRGPGRRVRPARIRRQDGDPARRVTSGLPGRRQGWAEAGLSFFTRRSNRSARSPGTGKTMVLVLSLAMPVRVCR